MKAKHIEIDLGQLQVDIEFDAKGLSYSMRLPWWRIRWMLFKAGLKLMFS